MNDATRLDAVQGVRRWTDELVAAKNNAYHERDQLVALLAAIYPSWMGYHEGEWEDDWRNIVYIQTREGQLSWHIHDSELPLFAHVSPGTGQWDRHTTERIRKLVEELST
jgi:hypothetical protein